jgi:hypothetical protein
VCGSGALLPQSLLRLGCDVIGSGRFLNVVNRFASIADLTVERLLTVALCARSNGPSFIACGVDPRS